MINNETIKAAMAEAKMNAVMVMGEVEDWDNQDAVNAGRAISKADSTGNAVMAANADRLSEVWINKNETAAMAIISRRIAKRAKLAAAPMSDTAAKMSRMED
jgi:hypothetical protein